MKGAVALLIAVLLSSVVQAHEVYVLDAETVTSGFATRDINVFSALQNPVALTQFIIGTCVILMGLLLMSYVIHTKLSKKLDEHFAYMRKYAHLIIRVGLGISFAWGAYHNSVFGPEIALSTVPGGMLWKPLLLAAGIMLIFGAFTRIAALICFAAFAAVTWDRGWYMMNYLNYFGEIIVLLLERGELFSVDHYVQWNTKLFHHKIPEWMEKLETFGEQYSFPIIRITLGIALIWASMSVKILFPQVSLSVLEEYNMVSGAVAALFIVLVVGVLEILIGLILVTGMIYRISLLIFVFMIGYSVWFFGEAVWPHAILVATGIGLFLHGRDRLSLEDWLYSKCWGWTKRFRKSTSALSPE